MEASPGPPQPDPGPKLAQFQVQVQPLPPRPNGAARHSKRLTLNFPINLSPTKSSDGSPSSPGSMTPTHSSRQSSALPGTPVPFQEDKEDDGTGILTAIASQERKVLELREELQRAESELATLKKQWTSSEKTRKRTEINHKAEPLLPIKSPELPALPALPADEGSQHSREQSISSTRVPVRTGQEQDRRQTMRAAAGSRPSTSGRRVFQGSHTRALSLLSTPDMATKQDSELSSASPNHERTRYPRAATLPSVERSTETTFRTPNDLRATNDVPHWQQSMPPHSRDALMRTGKQMASDLREGLWTFFEDIRQATVGEEGIHGTEARGMSTARKRDSGSTSRSREDRLSVPRGKSSRSPRGRRSPVSASGRENRSAKRSPEKSPDIGTSFWNEFGVDNAGRKSPNTSTDAPRQMETSQPNVEVEDNWDSWDTLQGNKMHTPSSSRSTLESKQQSPITQSSSPRTSAR